MGESAIETAAVFRVMTYNVRYFAHSAPVRGLGSTRSGLRRVAEALASMESLPDVIALQEVESRSLRSKYSLTKGHPAETQLEALSTVLNQDLALLSRGHAYTAYYFPAHAYRVMDLRLYTTGLAVLLRDDVRLIDRAVQDVTHRRHQRWAKPAAVLKQSRICAHMHVEKAGARLHVFNTHLSLPAFLSPRMLRTRDKLGWGFNQLQEADVLVDFVHARLNGTPHVTPDVIPAKAGTHTHLPHDNAAAHVIPAKPVTHTHLPHDNAAAHVIPAKAGTHTAPPTPQHSLPSPEPFILMGDFNSQPGSPTYDRILTGLNAEDSARAHLADEAEALRRGWPTAGFLNLRMRLDHLMTNSAVEVTDFEDTHPYGDRSGRWHGLSDHVPLVARLTLR